MEFADAVIERLGKVPQKLEAAVYDANAQITIKPYVRPVPAKKELQGVDVFVDSGSQTADELGAQLQSSNGVLSLQMITNRGVKVWPQGFEETFCTDHWRCRFTTGNEHVSLSNQLIINLLQRLLEDGIDVVKTENLYNFNGEIGYSLGQGQ
jgi:isocitrate dehydrogenase